MTRSIRKGSNDIWRGTNSYRVDRSGRPTLSESGGAILARLLTPAKTCCIQQRPYFYLVHASHRSLEVQSKHKINKTFGITGESLLESIELPPGGSVIGCHGFVGIGGNLVGYQLVGVGFLGLWVVTGGRYLVTGGR